MKNLIATLLGKKTATANIVERPVKANDDGLLKFQTALAKQLPKHAKSPQAIMETIVETALVSEFSPEIKKKKYYARMKKVIMQTMLKDPIIMQEAAVVAEKYITAAPKVKAITAVKKKTASKKKVKTKKHA